ncbi:AAA family ATPase [Roseospira navarrensis]|uniref:AAA family ATPase n=1 Tax=Roseospira navarrensis TaxID=140058 RepID=A0A7X1ZFC5_9PROT|nr:AAA family ATPase [Roseospira navarrensis]MQX37466.1 AAA family ATPase [Roseospira navarrensis]
MSDPDRPAEPPESLQTPAPPPVAEPGGGEAAPGPTDPEAPAYLDPFGFRRAPFSEAARPAVPYVPDGGPDPVEAVEGALGTALTAATDAAAEPEGWIVALIGPAGVGKSLTVHFLARRLKDRRAVGYLNGLEAAHQGARWDASAALCRAFGLPADGAPSETQRTLRIFLEDRWARGQQGLLIVDEAQALGVVGLDALAVLATSLVRDGGQPPLQVALAGPDTLSDMLERPTLRTLAGGLAATVRIGPFTAAQAVEYMDHRIMLARRMDVDFDPITAEAKALIAQAAQGVPGRINALCDAALALTAEDALPRVGVQQASEAIERLMPEATPADPAAPATLRAEVGDRPPRTLPGRDDGGERSGRWRRVAAGLALVALLGGGGWLLVRDPAALDRVGDVARTLADRGSALLTGEDTAQTEEAAAPAPDVTSFENAPPAQDAPTDDTTDDTAAAATDDTTAADMPPAAMTQGGTTGAPDPQPPPDAPATTPDAGPHLEPPAIPPAPRTVPEDERVAEVLARLQALRAQTGSRTDAETPRADVRPPDPEDAAPGAPGDANPAPESVAALPMDSAAPPPPAPTDPDPVPAPPLADPWAGQAPTPGEADDRATEAPQDTVMAPAPAETNESADEPTAPEMAAPSPETAEAPTPPEPDSAPDAAPEPDRQPEPVPPVADAEPPTEEPPPAPEIPPAAVAALDPAADPGPEAAASASDGSRSVPPPPTAKPAAPPRPDPAPVQAAPASTGAPDPARAARVRQRAEADRQATATLNALSLEAARSGRTLPLDSQVGDPPIPLPPAEE